VGFPLLCAKKREGGGYCYGSCDNGGKGSYGCPWLDIDSADDWIGTDLAGDRCFAASPRE